MKRIKSLPIFLKIPLVLFLILIITIIAWLIWIEIDVENQDEIQHSAYIIYWKSKDCIKECSIYGRSVNVKKKGRNYLIDGIKQGYIGGGQIKFNNKIINASSWNCQEDNTPVDINNRKLEEDAWYDCWLK